jgi:hypothetical protein
MPRSHSCRSSRYSFTTTTNSIATPITTRTIQNFSQASSDDQEFSRLLSLASRVDGSMGRFYESAYRTAVMQMVGIGACFVIAIAAISGPKLFVQLYYYRNFLSPHTTEGPIDNLD